MANDLAILRRRAYAARRNFKDTLRELFVRYKKLVVAEKNLRMFENEGFVSNISFDPSQLYASFASYISDLFNNSGFVLNNDWYVHSWFVLQRNFASWGVLEDLPSFDGKASKLFLSEVKNGAKRNNRIFEK